MKVERKDADVHVQASIVVDDALSVHLDRLPKREGAPATSRTLDEICAIILKDTLDWFSTLPDDARNVPISVSYRGRSVLLYVHGVERNLSTPERWSLLLRPVPIPFIPKVKCAHLLRPDPTFSCPTCGALPEVTP